jgi:selenocysteine lyase/cysteine desulfurase
MSACAPAARASVSRVDYASDDDFWEMVRKQYPLTRERTYLNTGGLGPATYAALDAMNKTQMDLQRISEHGHSKFAEVRETAAAFLGADASELAFTRNATEGNATIASGMKLKSGDEVIFESHAHPGGAIPWMTRQKETGVRVKVFEPDPTSASGNLERIAQLITSRTRVVQVSHITAPTGILMPVDEIAKLCRDKGIWFHIDGAQSAGAIPFDLHSIGCQSYAACGHKWLGAPHGTGVLFIQSGRMDEVVPTEVGAYSNSDYELPAVFDYTETAQRYEPGTRDVTSVVGMQAAIGFMTSIGMDRVASYTKGLGVYLHEQLAALDRVEVLTPADPDLRGAMTTYKVEGISYTDLYTRLFQDHRLRCRVVSERGLNALRVSTHVFNSRADCDKVVAGTKELLAG